MIVPNVLNRPFSGMPGLSFLDGGPQRLSTTDYFRSWEALPEAATLAFPRLLDLTGNEFRRDRLDPKEPRQNLLCLMRSSWSLMASAARRWREGNGDAVGVRGAPQLTLRAFKPAAADFKDRWSFDDGSDAGQKLGSVTIDDDEGRLLTVSQKSPDDDLVITAGWKEDYPATSVVQRTRITAIGGMSVGYAFEFGQAAFEGLKEAVELNPADDAPRLAMRLAALILNGGQYAAGSLGPFVYETSDKPSGLMTAEENSRIGFLGQPGTWVSHRRFVNIVNKKRRSYYESVRIQLAPPLVARGPFTLRPVLLEKLWNPVHARVLSVGIENPLMA